MRRALARGLARFWNRPPVALDLYPSSPDEIVDHLFWAEPQPLRFHLKPDILVMQGAFSYAADHPFIVGLREGPSALRSFYDRFQPRDLADMYSLPRAGSTGESLPPWELPWLMRAKREPPRGEAGLGPEHGVAYYGPATDQKVATEFARLTRVVDSVKARGYRPDRYGEIEGYFVKCGGDLRFFVRGGKHRTAALCFLGFERIPVRIRTTLPRVIDINGAQDWPLVRAGKIEPDLARSVLSSYFARPLAAAGAKPDTDAQCG